MVQPMDVSSVIYVLPIATFLLVTFIVFAVLQKLKLFGDSAWPTAFVSFVIATLFISVVGTIDYLKYIGAWIAILLISMVFLLAIIGMFGKNLEGMSKGVGIVIIIIAVLIFLVSGLVVYSSYITPYLPGGQAVGSYSVGGFLSYFLYSPKILSAIILLVVGAIVSWILSRAK